jgi:hypothetical protein
MPQTVFEQMMDFSLNEIYSCFGIPSTLLNEDQVEQNNQTIRVVRKEDWKSKAVDIEYENC